MTLEMTTGSFMVTMLSGSWRWQRGGSGPHPKDPKEARDWGSRRGRRLSRGRPGQASERQLAARGSGRRHEQQKGGEQPEQQAAESSGTGRHSKGGSRASARVLPDGERKRPTSDPARRTSTGLAWFCLK